MQGTGVKEKPAVKLSGSLDLEMSLSALRLPGHHWVTVHLGHDSAFDEDPCEPGHSWRYLGIIRRDAWVWKGWHLVIQRMPRATHEERLVRTPDEERVGIS
jgi:hypothetical protein